MSDAPLRILVVEDEATIADILIDYLRQAGFDPYHIGDGRVALEDIKQNSPAAVVLDIMLPGLDGIRVCGEVRKFSSVPIIMVTARVDEIDRLLGLDIGADDYICKPFSPREVVARVKTVLRRSAPAGQEKTGIASKIDIDESRQRITVCGHPLDLTPTEYRLLRLLTSHPGRIYSRSQILDMAYCETDDVSDRIIDSHIKNIRKKVAVALPDLEIIHSVYGIGYRFEM